MIDDPETFSAYSGTNTPTAIMAANDDVLHAELIYRIFDHGEHVQISRMDKIGDVTMHENFARLQAGDHISWYATIRTADPEIFRALQVRKTFKIISPFGFSFLGPYLVAGKKFFDHHHSGRLASADTPIFPKLISVKSTICREDAWGAILQSENILNVSFREARPFEQSGLHAALIHVTDDALLRIGAPSRRPDVAQMPVSKKHPPDWNQRG